MGRGRISIEAAVASASGLIPFALNTETVRFIQIPSGPWMRRHSSRIYRIALADGLLIRPKKCQRCPHSVARPRYGRPRYGNRSTIHGHHRNYEFPCAVLWLCAGCHGADHALMNEARRIGIPVEILERAA